MCAIFRRKPGGGEVEEEEKGGDLRADIVVSELLGSFGDNELSPECLYDAEDLFKPDAVSIPSSYTSWIGPLQVRRPLKFVHT